MKRIVAACFGYQGIAPGYLNELACTVTGANTVSVNTGGCMVDGKVYNNTAAVSVNIPSAVGGGNTRIDRVVIRLSWAGDDAAVTRIAGTDAAAPVAPAITQTSGTTYDIQIAQVLVTTAGTCTVTDERDFAEPTELAMAVLGNAANTTAATWGAIAAASDHTVLQRHGTSLGFATIQAGMFAAGSVTAGAYGADSITITDIGALLPGFLGRQGGAAGSWVIAGTTNYSAGVNPRIQAGSALVGAGGLVTVTFPVPFSQNPLVFCQTLTQSYLYPTAYSTTQVTITDSSATGGATAHWLAIGVE